MTQSALVFDLGTTYFKAALLTGKDEFIAVTHVPTPITHPHADQSEMTAEDFLDAIGQLMLDLQRQTPKAYQQIQHISFATQANSFLLLDEAFEPVTPILVWNDQRARSLQLPVSHCYERTGIPACSNKMASAKLFWIQHNQPHLWAQARHMCFLSDYLTHHFTGKHITEAGMAGLSGMVDIHQLCWRSGIIDGLHLQRLRLPVIQRAGTSLGNITPEAAARYQLHACCCFTLGCLDQYAGALAAGLLDQDGLCETTGTVLASVRAADCFDSSLQKQNIFQGPAPREGWYFRMLFGSLSANMLAVFRKKYTPELSYEDLDAMASQLAVDDQRLQLKAVELCVPRFDFAGDPMYMDTAHMVQAIYYKVARELEIQVKTHYPETLPDRVMSLGGGANSLHWLAIKARVLGTEVLPILSEKPTCLGVYRLIQCAK